MPSALVPDAVPGPRAEPEQHEALVQGAVQAHYAPWARQVPSAPEQHAVQVQHVPSEQVPREAQVLHEAQEPDAPPVSQDVPSCVAPYVPLVSCVFRASDAPQAQSVPPEVQYAPSYAEHCVPQG